MIPKDGCVFDWVVYVWCQFLDELLVCNDSSLLKSIHAFDNLNVKKSLVVDYGKKSVLIDDFLGDDRDVYFHILGVG